MSHFIKQYLEDRAKCSVEANAKRKEEIVMRMKLYDEKKMVRLSFFILQFYLFLHLTQYAMFEGCWFF